MTKETYNMLADLFYEFAEFLKLKAGQDSSVAPVPVVTKEAAPEQEEATEGYTREQLDGMTYSDLKKLAAECGVKVVGNKDAITKAILEAAGDIVITEEEHHEEAPVEDGEESDELFEVINAYSDADLKSVLKSAGIGTTGKHEALVDKVMRAINEGKISNPLEEANSAGDEENEIENELLEMFPIFSANYDKDKITPERAETLQNIQDEVVDSGEEYDESELDELLTGFLSDKYDPDAFSIEGKIQVYAEIRKLFVDDDGEEHEDNDIYKLNGVNYCCGGQLTLDKKTKKYSCTACGSKKAA